MHNTTITTTVTTTAEAAAATTTKYLIEYSGLSLCHFRFIGHVTLKGNFLCVGWKMTKLDLPILSESLLQPGIDIYYSSSLFTLDS